MNAWTGLEEFVAVADHGSISAAAHALGTPRATVSRRIRELEASLGVTLAYRTTRVLELTRAGRLLHERARVLLDLGQTMREDVIKLDGVPRGSLRVSLPNGPNPWFSDVLADFVRAFPEIRVEVLATSRAVDLARERVDVVLRAGQHVDEGLVGRKLASSRVLCVGTPTYVERHGRPETPEDLIRHSCALWGDQSGRPRTGWPRLDGAGDITVRGNFSSNDPFHLLGFVLTHSALGLLPAQFVDPLIASGELEHILPTSVGGEGSVWILYVPTRYQLPAVRAFVDHVCSYDFH